MNPLNESYKTGTIGELLLQLKLLQYDVQASFPLKDSGNDLIGIKGDVFRAIQVKTTTNSSFNFNFAELPEKYHILALIKLQYEGRNLCLDQSKIFLLKKENVSKGYFSLDELRDNTISQSIIDEFFQ